MRKNIWTPTPGTVIIPAAPERTVETVINRPPAGTRIKATLGESVLVGKVNKTHHDSPHQLLYVDVKTPRGKSEVGNTIALWFDSGWTFEILEPALAVAA
jgi:hypothetical protein